MFEVVDPADPVTGAVATAIAALRREDRSGWSAAARAQRVRELAALADRLEAELVVAVDELDRDQGWQTDGAVSAHGWLTAHTPASRIEATDLVRAARFRRRFDATAACLATGELSVARFKTLARRVTLVNLASSLGRTDDVRVVMARWATLADDELASADADVAHGRRRLSLSRGMNGCGLLDGELTPDGYAIVKAALDALDQPDRDEVAGGPRTPAQRRADNLVELCRRSLAEHTADTGPAAARGVTSTWRGTRHR